MRASLLLSALLLCSPLCAHADTIKTFDFNSDLTGGYTAQGLINIDVTDGQVVGSSFTLSQNGMIDARFTNPDSSSGLFNGVYLAEFQDSADGYTYELLLPNATLIGYLGGSPCTITATCIGYPSGAFLLGGGNAEAIDGTLDPTPEPASVVMLATGLAAGYVVSRRRWA